jgi:hypothetical protein
MPQCLYQRVINEAPTACGKCINCRNKRIAGWSARLMKEDAHSCASFFLTLTYNPDKLMFCPKNRPTLWPSHLTSYWKMLRKNLKKTTFKYYACGEYGSNRQRPHYHAIFMVKNTDLSAVQLLNAIEKYWPHGETFVGTVTAESVAYVLKYISKKGSVPQYAGDTRTKEFQRSSKGLGIDYLKNIGNWHTNDLLNRAYIPLQGGNRAPVPRYYKDKLYTKEQREQIGKYMEQTTTTPDYVNLKNLRLMSDKKTNAKPERHKDEAMTQNLIKGKRKAVKSEEQTLVYTQVKVNLA